MTAERFTAVFTGSFHWRSRATPPLLMDGYPPVSGHRTFDQDRPHRGELGQETSFPELPQDCKNPVLDTYEKVRGL